MKKKIVSIILVFGMMLGLAGCNAITIDGEGETVENAGNGTIGLSVSTLNNPFFVALAEGAEAAAEKEGVKLAVADAGLLMPPKSTWFEPKLRSGLFIHRLG